MKTTLLFVGASLCVMSCGDSNVVNTEELSTEEMKSKVEVEEILFEEPEVDIVGGIESKPPDSDIERATITSNKLKKVLPSDEDIVTKVWKPHREPRVTPTDIPKLPVPPHGGYGSDTLDCGAYHSPEISAQFPGGVVELRKFIDENIQYPAREFCVQGRVYVSFDVEKDGCVTHLEVLRGGISKELNEEAFRLIRSMPKWIPAQNNGKVVVAKVRLPISFYLN